MNLTSRAAVFVAEEELSGLLDTIRRISDDHLFEMQKNGQHLYQSYFSSIKTITNTALDILNERVFPQSSKTYEEWNVAPNPVGLLNWKNRLVLFVSFVLVLLSSIIPFNSWLHAPRYSCNLLLQGGKVLLLWC